MELEYYTILKEIIFTEANGQMVFPMVMEKNNTNKKFIQDNGKTINLKAQVGLKEIMIDKMIIFTEGNLILVKEMDSEYNIQNKTTNSMDNGKTIKKMVGEDSYNLNLYIMDNGKLVKKMVQVKLKEDQNHINSFGQKAIIVKTKDNIDSISNIMN